MVVPVKLEESESTDFLRLCCGTTVMEGTVSRGSTYTIS